MKEIVPREGVPGPRVDELSARLTSARQDYLKALALRREAARLKATLDLDNPVGTAALLAANREVSFASMRFERALQDFISVTCVRRRTEGVRT